MYFYKNYICLTSREFDGNVSAASPSAGNSDSAPPSSGPGSQAVPFSGRIPAIRYCPITCPRHSLIDLEAACPTFSLIATAEFVNIDEAEKALSNLVQCEKVSYIVGRERK